MNVFFAKSLPSVRGQTNQVLEKHLQTRTTASMVPAPGATRVKK